MSNDKPSTDPGNLNYVRCPACEGAGQVKNSGEWIACNVCRTSGQVRNPERLTLQKGESMGVRYYNKPLGVGIECTGCGDLIRAEHGETFRIVVAQEDTSGVVYSVVHDDDECLHIVGGSRH